jgi:hypothetical protein
MSVLKLHQHGIVLLEAVVVLMTVVPITLFGWNLACYYQMHHELRRVVDAEFRFGSATDLEAIVFDSGAKSHRLNREEVFRTKLLKLRNNICTKLLFKRSCAESIAVQLLHSGRLYTLGALSTHLLSVDSGSNDYQIVITVKIVNQFQNLRTLTGQFFDTTILMRKAYQGRGGMVWVG